MILLSALKNMTKKVYRASNPTVIFTSASVLNSKGNDLIFYELKNFLVYTYKCCCANSYIGQTSGHLEMRIKEHISRSLRSILKRNLGKGVMHPQMQLKG